MKIHAALHDAQVQGVANKMAGGILRVYGEGINKAETNALVVEVKFHNTPQVQGSTILFDKLPDSEVRLYGKPKLYKLFAADGKTILIEGVVGKGGSMVLDKQFETLYPGMKFGLKKFSYTIQFKK